MNKKLIIASALSIILLPVVALAFIAPPIPTQKTFSQVVDGIIGILWPIIAAASIIAFFVAAFFFVTSNGDADKVGTARQALIYGAVGVIVSIVAVSIPTIIKTLSGL